MITVKDLEVKNYIQEFTLEEFNKMVQVDIESDPIEGWIKILGILGVSEEIAESLTPEELLEFVRGFCKSEGGSLDIPEEITVGEKTWTLKPAEKPFEITIRVFAQIDEMIKKTGKIDLVKACALCLKTPGLSTKDELKEENTKRKMKAIKKISMEILMGLVMHIIRQLGVRLKFAMGDEATV